MSSEYFGKWETAECITKETSEGAKRQNSACDFVTGYVILKLTKKKFISYVYILLKHDENQAS